MCVTTTGHSEPKAPPVMVKAAEECSLTHTRTHTHTLTFGWVFGSGFGWLVLLFAGPDVDVFSFHTSELTSTPNIFA